MSELTAEIFKAATLHDFAKLRELIAAGANINVKDEGEETPFHGAVTETKYELPIETAKSLIAEQLEAARVLLAAGADVNTMNKNGDTPLHDAVVNGNDYHLEIAKAFVDAGADPDAKNRFGETPLQQVGDFLPTWPGRTEFLELVREKHEEANMSWWLDKGVSL